MRGLPDLYQHRYPPGRVRSDLLPKITPVPLTRIAAPFDHPDWLFELKYDGFCALLYLQNGTAQLVSRRGIIYRRFDSLCANLAMTVKVHDAILDGELVCLDQDGRPMFDALIYRRAEPCFVAFDLLWLNGNDYREKPLLHRKAVLRQLVPSGSVCVLYASEVVEHGIELFRVARERNLEGIVGKHKDSVYGDGARWLKIKNPEYTQAVGRAERFQRRRA